jgi:hypothetical protein
VVVVVKTGGWWVVVKGGGEVVKMGGEAVKADGVLGDGGGGEGDGGWVWPSMKLRSHHMRNWIRLAVPNRASQLAGVVIGAERAER